ncbi:MAG: hypothetical protein ACYSU4_13680, partial [Planctomycetota bacterium]
ELMSRDRETGNPPEGWESAGQIQNLKSKILKWSQSRRGVMKCPGYFKPFFILLYGIRRLWCL